MRDSVAKWDLHPSLFHRSLQRSHCTGTALCSIGSLGSVPRLQRSYCGAPTSRSPAVAHVFRSLPRSGCPEAPRSPRFLGDPCLRALRFDPDEVCFPRPRACGPVFWVADIAFHQVKGVGPRNLFLSGFNHTARRPAVYASQPPSRTHHARLALGWWPPPWPDGTFTRGSQRKVSDATFVLSQACPGALTLKGLIRATYRRHIGFCRRIRRRACRRLRGRGTK